MIDKFFAWFYSALDRLLQVCENQKRFLIPRSQIGSKTLCSFKGSVLGPLFFLSSYTFLQRLICKHDVGFKTMPLIYSYTHLFSQNPQSYIKWNKNFSPNVWLKRRLGTKSARNKVALYENTSVLQKYTVKSSNKAECSILHWFAFLLAMVEQSNYLNYSRLPVSSNQRGHSPLTSFIDETNHSTAASWLFCFLHHSV